MDDEEKIRRRLARRRYREMLPTIREVARKHGYAVAVHGSESRDFDLIAAPWTGEAVAADALVEHLVARLNEVYGVGFIVLDGTTGGKWDPAARQYVPVEVRQPEIKPHGRKAWSIQIGRGHYIDLSVMPVTTS